MYMTKNEFNAIEKALRLLPHGEAFESLPDCDKQAIIEADSVMVNLLKKRKKHNQKTAQYIAKKRKTNKNYCR